MTRSGLTTGFGLTRSSRRLRAWFGSVIPSFESPCVIVSSLPWRDKDLVRRLNGLELQREFSLAARIPIRVVLQSCSSTLSARPYPTAYTIN